MFGTKAEGDTLEAPYVMEYTYRRSLGPVMSAFFTGLREGRLSGARTASGDVVVPPLEWDPATGEPIAELVPLPDTGELVTWCWISEVEPRHPLQEPFAWALIKPDGATTAMLHALRVDPEALRPGLRVKAVWAAERTGTLRDIVCFEQEGA